MDLNPRINDADNGTQPCVLPLPHIVQPLRFCSPKSTSIRPPPYSPSEEWTPVRKQRFPVWPLLKLPYSMIAFNSRPTYRSSVGIGNAKVTDHCHTPLQYSPIWLQPFALTADDYTMLCLLAFAAAVAARKMLPGMLRATYPTPQV